MMMVPLNIMYGDVCTDDRCTGGGVQAGCIMTMYTGAWWPQSQSCSAGRRVHISDTVQTQHSESFMHHLCHQCQCPVKTVLFFIRDPVE